MTIKENLEYELYLMRHGPAAPRGVNSITDDARRPLTPEGKERMQQIAAGLLRTGMEVDWVISSPLVRAAETAEIVAETLRPQLPLDLCDALRPAGDPEAFIAFLAQHADRRRVIAVGHEPDLSQFAARLIGAGRNANLSFKKGGCCLITFGEFPPKRPGQLSWWLTPRLMRKLG